MPAWESVLAPMINDLWVLVAERSGALPECFALLLSSEH